MNKIIIDNQTLKLIFNLSTIRHKNHFLRKIQEFFEFPAYFDDNFDALNDCMRDLSWFSQENIIIEFQNLDKINNIQLKDFIKECLISYQDYWQNSLDKNVTIIIK